jgi:hypothetical protein
MSKYKKTEVFGMLEKTETLFTIHEKTLPGSLVFESLAPFPGYYTDVPNDSKPVYLYIGLDKEYSVFDIERANQAVKKVYNWSFEAAKAKIIIYDKAYDVVRLRHLDSFDQLAAIQEKFAKNGLKPKMSSNKWKGDNGYIKLHKLFYIKKLDKGIYLDASEDFHSYIILPRKLTPDEFAEITLQVKYNASSSSFDAAAGCFFIKGELKEMVRIYTKKDDPNYLKELQSLYLSRVKK